MTAKRLDCTFAEYHKDPCETPSLSSSIARKIVDESPLHAWTAHPRFGAVNPVATEDMQKGTILHKLLLGKGTHLHVMDVENFRTKAAREERDEAIAQGKLPIKTEDFEQYGKAAARIATNLDALGMSLTGESEVPIQWEEKDQHGNPVICRAMLDHVFLDRGLIFDLKKVESANPRAIERRLVQMGYDIQHEAYSRAVRKLTEHNDVQFVFLFCEIAPPFAVVPIMLDGAFREIGKLRWRQAINTWSHCLRTKHWPSYSEDVVYISPPAYVAAEHLGNSES